MGLFSAIGNFFSSVGNIAKVVAPVAALIPGLQGVASVATAVSKIAPAADDLLTSIDKGSLSSDGLQSVIEKATAITNDAKIYLRDTSSTRIAPN
jgi:hypothetical protein